MSILPLLKKSSPHAIAVVVFLALTLLFYAPIFFQNKTLNQNDVNQGIASGREVVEFRNLTGEEALWTNSMFGGMPAYLIATHWSGQAAISVVEKVISLGLPSSARETFLGMLCFYVLMLCFGVRPSLAMAGAVAYGFSTFFIISLEAGHVWKVRAIAYAPLVVAGIHLIYTRRLWLGLGLSALALALEFNSNHPQIAYYTAIVVGLYIVAKLVESLRNKEIKTFAISSAIASLALVLAVGANLGKLWSSYEYGNYSIRGKSNINTGESSSGLDAEYVFTWSSGKAETFTFLVPHFYGGASGGYRGSGSELEQALTQNNAPPDQISQLTRGTLSYWGTQPWVNGPVYAGAIVCFLFVIGLIYADSTYKWWLVAATVLGIVLSWGKNFAAFNYFVYDFLPFYNKFRAVSMTVVIAMLTMPLLGMLGLEKMLQEGDTKKFLKNLGIALGCTGGLALIIAMVAYVPALEAGQVPEWFIDAVKSSRKSIVRTDGLRSFFMILAGASAIYFFVKKKVNAFVFGTLLVALVAVDIIAVDFRYVNSENYINKRNNTFLQATPADERIMKDADLGYRVLNFSDPFNDARTSAFHHSVGGYHGAKLSRYKDLIDSVLTREITNIAQSGAITRDNTNMLSALNTKYILTGLNENNVVRNPYNNGPAWFVASAKSVGTAEEELNALNHTNLRQTVVIDASKMTLPQFEYDSAATVKLVSYAPNHLVYEAASTKDGYVVFSEIYYPKGWHAILDGQEVPIDRVDYLLRGMAVPSGNHKIEFYFSPRAYTVGNPVMMASSWLVLLVFAFAIAKALMAQVKEN